MAVYCVSCVNPPFWKNSRLKNIVCSVHVNLSYLIGVMYFCLRRNHNHNGRQTPRDWLCLPLCLVLFQGTLQEVIAWGLLGWKLYANVNGPIHCKALSSLGVTQIVCSEKGFLILSSSGAVYTQNYKSTTLVSSLMTTKKVAALCLLQIDSLSYFFAGSDVNPRSELQKDHKAGSSSWRAALLGPVIQWGGVLVGLWRWRPPWTWRHHVSNLRIHPSDAGFWSFPPCNIKCKAICEGVLQLCD